MKIYVAGPITGYPDNNRTAFLNATVRLDGLGHRAINPHELIPDAHDGPCPTGPHQDVDDHALPCYLRADLKALLDCDAIYLLRGWEASTGANAEFQTARSAGLQVFYEATVTL